MAQAGNPYQVALVHARAALEHVSPYAVALRSGASVLPGGVGLELAYWGRSVEVRWPAGEVLWVAGGEPSTVVQLLVLHYLIAADGAPMGERWVAFRELADGRVYDSAFYKRACAPLERAFGQRLSAFVETCVARGGERLTFGDASFMFQVLPRVRVALVLYTCDDEFPARASVLFDAATRHYLPIEDVAVLGGMVVGSIVRGAET